MLGSLRSGQLVRVAVAFAALLSLTASAGLHPEPHVARVATAAAGPVLAAGSPTAQDAPHVCLACIIQLAGALAAFGPAAPAVASARTVTSPPSDRVARGPEIRCRRDRAPPTAS